MDWVICLFLQVIAPLGPKKERERKKREMNTLTHKHTKNTHMEKCDAQRHYVVIGTFAPVLARIVVFK